MIRINPSPEFDAEFELLAPRSSDPVTVTFRFRSLGNSDFDSLAIAIGYAPASFWKRWYHQARLAWRLKRRPLVVDVLASLVVAWDGIEDEYSRDALAQLINMSANSHVRIFNAYVRNRIEAHRKN